jgi:hypothetical protein
MVILRTDYMIDKALKQLCVIEFNTIACGIGILSKKSEYVHNYIMNKYGEELTFNYNRDLLKTNQSSMLNYDRDFASAIHRSVVAY